MIAATPHLLFSAGRAEALFALEVEHVWQVIEIESQPVAVPLAPTLVAGVINHHGRILTVVDPAALLELEPGDAFANQVVVLRRAGAGGGHLGLRVGATRGILAGDRFTAEDLPVGPCVSAVARLDDELVHVVDHAQFMESLIGRFEPLGDESPRAEQSV